MGKQLLIVESPAKAKTIEKFLGKDFTVKSSYGHIRDLDKGDKAVDIEKGFLPKYVITPEKGKVVKELKDWVKKVDDVWLATDEDREGEAISWHLCDVLGLDPKTTKRIVFHEITKTAIQKAVATPRNVDLHLVNAQQARRVLDRLVGFELSELLWRKVRGKLSAGRVQSVAVKLIVEREREIRQFETAPFYKIQAKFQVKDKNGRTGELSAELPQRFQTEKEAQDYLEKSAGSTFIVGSIDISPVKKKPAPPFNTSTLQQEASRKLGFAVQRTMSAAQKLYEAGHITYMRTDSLNLSDQALAAMAKEIEDSYGKEYVHIRKYKSKVSNAQEAHEAIRPTYMDKRAITGDKDQVRLYELIWKRAIASQMAEAELEKTTVRIDVSKAPDRPLEAVGEVLKFEGFLKVYIEGRDDDDEEEAKGMLPPIVKGQNLDLLSMSGTERFTRPPARYTEAGLVKRMEELGIGRPSTYAPTISKIMEEGRGYVIKVTKEGSPREYTVLTLENGKIKKSTQKEIIGAIKNQLMPTDMGILVTDFLDNHFQSILNYQFTAKIEQQFDEIANGKIAWQSMLKDFYGPFHKQVEVTQSDADRASGERVLGQDPLTGKTVLTRMSRFGPVVQLGKNEELTTDEKLQYANLVAGQSMDTITLEEALGLFRLPKELGIHQGQNVSVGLGRYGPYIKWGDLYVSLPRSEDPLTVTTEKAIELITDKVASDAPICHYQGEPVTKGKGRFGPFLKWKDLYVNLPAKVANKDLTVEEVAGMIEAKIDKEANRYIQRWESEQISIENGRWGPFIRFKKANFKLPKGTEGKMSDEEIKALTLDQVKAIINEQAPGSIN